MRRKPARLAEVQFSNCFILFYFFLTLETIAILEEKTQEGSGSGTLSLLHRGQSLGGAGGMYGQLFNLKTSSSRKTEGGSEVQFIFFPKSFWTLVQP